MDRLVLGTREAAGRRTHPWRERDFELSRRCLPCGLTGGCVDAVVADPPYPLERAAHLDEVIVHPEDETTPTVHVPLSHEGVA
jgi:hypothetical protein